MIDTHAHIDDEQYAQSLLDYLADQRANGVERILVPATDAPSCRRVLQTCLLEPDYCIPAFGIHPEEVREDWQAQMAQMKDFYYSLQDAASALCAIGEIGLDYHFDVTYKSEQQLCFREQLEWALELGLPVMIHSRDATADTLAILREYTSRGLCGVMHCFSGSYETAMEIVKMGMYLGIGGVITFKNSRLAQTLSGEGRDSIPLERLVLETDCPYMAPVPFRGQRNESKYIKYVIDKLCEVYQLPYSEIERITTENAKHLFRLK